jgi:prepilin-type N-terminal cleavage/methylation domain-containing protein
MNAQRASARAFTLVELLVVIAIIGVLVALLLPAVQAAREAGRRTECTNHIRQLGLACQMHADANKFLPSAGWGDWWVGCPDLGSGERQPGNWTYQLLPFIEESARRGLGRGYKCGDPASRAAMGQMVSTPVSIFYCPSRRAAQAYPWVNNGNFNFDPPPLAAKTDYAASFGDVQFFDSDIGPPTLADYDEWVAKDRFKHSGPRFALLVQGGKYKTIAPAPTGHTGVIFQRSHIKYAEIEDGLSNTYLIGEKNLDPDHYEDGVPVNDDQTMYSAHDKDNLRSTFVWAPGNEVSPAQFIARPDTPGSANNPDRGKFEWAFGGPHPAGWIAAFCDGSVRFLSYDMEPHIHQRLGNRQDGQLIDGGF